MSVCSIGKGGYYLMYSRLDTGVMGISYPVSNYSCLYFAVLTSED